MAFQMSDYQKNQIITGYTINGESFAFFTHGVEIVKVFHW